LDAAVNWLNGLLNLGGNWNGDIKLNNSSLSYSDYLREGVFGMGVGLYYSP
jgi:hypothetical protein